MVIEHGPEPMEGTNVVNTWHDRCVHTALWVAGGPVVMRAHPRARVPKSWALNSRKVTTETVAHRSSRYFMRGINFGNIFEAPAGQDGIGAFSSTSPFNTPSTFGVEERVGELKENQNRIIPLASTVGWGGRNETNLASTCVVAAHST